MKSRTIPPCPLEQHWRASDLAERLGITPRTLDRWVKAKHFPPPIQLTPTIMRWPESAVLEYLARYRAYQIAHPDHVKHRIPVLYP